MFKFNKASVMVFCRLCGEELLTTMTHLKSRVPLICFSCGEPIVVAPEVLRQNLDSTDKIGLQFAETLSIGRRK